jgi:hypothetical protein
MHNSFYCFYQCNDASNDNQTTKVYQNKQNNESGNSKGLGKIQREIGSGFYDETAAGNARDLQESWNKSYKRNRTNIYSNADSDVSV